ncbi:MAG: hypothetical protein KBG20_23020 [Caldilineaceae bacterium]|nr:hypothetical protein [Caldilineaceae bacterium]
MPEWITEYVALWIGRLRLEEWRVYVRVVSHIEDFPGASGFCRQLPDINEIHLQFQMDIEDDDCGRIVILHELLHAQHARIDRVVQGVIQPALPFEVEGMARRAYTDAYESYIHRLAVSLYNLSKEGPNEST